MQLLIDMAMLAGDTSTVERLTADEYAQTDISGYVQDKSAWLNEYFRPLAALMKAGKFRWDTYEEEDVQVHMFGDTAVVIGSMNLKGTGAKPSGHTWVESRETTFAGTLRFTRVWVSGNPSCGVVACRQTTLTRISRVPSSCKVLDSIVTAKLGGVNVRGDRICLKIVVGDKIPSCRTCVRMPRVATFEDEVLE